MMERRPRAPVLRSMARRAIGMQRLVREGELDALHFEQALVLLDDGVLRLGENLHQRRFVEVLERRHHRQAADEFGDQAEAQQVFGLELAQHRTGAAVVDRFHFGAEADAGALAALADDAFKAGEGAAADEQDVGGIDLQEFLLRDACGRPGAARRRQCLP